MSKYKILNSAGIGSAALLAGLPVLFTLGPVVATQGAFADEPATANEEASGVMSMSITRALAITAENVNITATPTVGNTFVTASAKVNVKNTGAGGGYHLIMSSNSGGNITNTADASKAVSTFSGSERTKSGADMRSANVSSWGWTTQTVTNSKDNVSDLALTYNRIPASSDGWNADGSGGNYAYLKNTNDYSNMTAGDDITVGYAFAIGPEVPAGTYQDTITYTAIPNKDNTTIFDTGKVKTMQDFYKYDSACYNTPTPAVTAKANATSLADITDGAVGQTNANKVPTRTLKDSRTDTEYTIKKLADGHCWMTTSLAIAGQDIEPTKSNVTAEIITAAAAGGASGFDAGATKFTLPAATASTGTSNTATEPKVANDGVNSTMLYNWYAATAGTGKSTDTNKNAPGDICPKGWQLPNASGDMSWNKLLRVGEGVYQIAKSDNTYNNTVVDWGTYAGISTATANPLGLQLTGDFWSSKRENTGSGFYWTRTAHASDAERAYDLHYYSALVYPQYGVYKGIGFGIRCVSR